MKIFLYVVVILGSMWSVTQVHALWYLPVAAWLALWSVGRVLDETRR